MWVGDLFHLSEIKKKHNQLTFAYFYFSAYADALQFVGCQIDKSPLFTLGKHGVCIKPVHHCVPLEILCMEREKKEDFGEVT